MVRLVRLKKAIKRLYTLVDNSEGDRGSHELSAFMHAIEYSRDPIATLNYFSETLSYSEKKLWMALSKLNELRSPVFDCLLESPDSVLCQSIRIRLRAKFLIINPCEDKGFLDRLSDDYNDAKSKCLDLRVLTNIVVGAIVAKAPVAVVEEYLSRLGVDISRLTESQLIKLLSRCVDAKETLLFYHYKNSFGCMTPAAALKANQMQCELEGRGLESLKSIESSFLRLNFWVAKQYQAQIQASFDAIPFGYNYSHARFDPGAISYIRSYIVSRVVRGESLCYIRLGDGESYGLVDNEYVNIDGEARQELHWWGLRLDAQLRQSLQEKFKDAVARADILGVPTVLRLVRDFNLVKADRYPVNSLIARVFCVMRGVTPYLDKKIIVEDQSNLFLFDYDFLVKLFRVAKKVVIVSGVRSDLIKAWAPGIGSYQCIEIPTHRLLRKGKLGTSFEVTLPLVYSDYVSEIAAQAEPGVVFLISAGFVGKIFIAEAAKHGAVALDIGQALVSQVMAKHRELV